MNSIISRLPTIVGEAIEIASPEEREIYLQRACRDDETLRRRVDELLRDHARAGNFLEQPAAGVTLLAPATEAPGTQIGPYKLLEQIGEGGFGFVFMAEQTHLIRRQVALKVLKPGMDSNQVIARFEAERQALALMDHPNIARVLDAGATATGRPYFVMELVRGMPITEYCDEARLSPVKRLTLFVDVCQAVQHAHQKGIIHRDLKPSNVLVTLHGDKPVVKVIDFGIAKALGQRLTEHTLFTGFQQLLGTPLYMSPEQAQMSGLDVDTRSDVYSLGVLLYELLTGTTPFEKSLLVQGGFDSWRQMLREIEPPRPSARVSTLDEQKRSTVAERRRLDQRKIGEHLRGELDWIVMKALEKDRDRRYGSASALADDVDRHLRNEHVLACPPSTAYRLHKLIRRHALWLGTSASICLALVTGTGVAIWQAMRATDAQHKLQQQNSTLEQTGNRLSDALRESKRLQAAATTNERRTQTLLHVAEMQLAAKAWRQGDTREVTRLLSEDVNRLPSGSSMGFAWHYLNRQNSGMVVGDTAKTQHGVLIDRDQQQLYYATFSPDGEWLATCGSHGGIRIYSAHKDYELVRQIDTVQGEVNSVAFNPDRTLLASAGDDGTVCLWSWPESKLVRSISVYPGKKVFGVAFLADQRWLATCGSTNRVIVWNVETGEPAQTWEIDSPNIDAIIAKKRYKKNTEQTLTLAADDGEIHYAMFDANPAKRSIKFGQFTDGRTTCVAYSLNQKWLVAGFSNGLVYFEDVGHGQLTRRFRRADGIDAVAVRDDGTLICTDRGGSIVVDRPASNPKSLSSQQIWSGGAPRLPGLAIHPKGKHFITAASNGELRRWNIDEERSETEYVTIPSSNVNVYGRFCFLSRPVRVLQAGYDGISTQPLTPDGMVEVQRDLVDISSCDRREGIILLGTARGELIQLTDFVSIDRRFQVFPREDGRDLDEVTLYPQAAKALVRCAEEKLTVFDLSDGSQLATSDMHHVAACCLAPDGSLVAACERNSNAVALLDGATLRVQRRLLGHQGTPRRALFSPDQRRIVSVGSDRVGILWDVATGERLATLSGHRTSVHDAAYSLDGQTIATMDDAGAIKLWSAETGQEFYELATVGGPDSWMRFTSDGGQLVISRDDGSLAVFDGSPETNSLVP